MGDEKQYTIQVKGTAYRFKPLPPDDIERVMMINNLNLSTFKVVKAVTRVLANSAGEEQWDQITDRYMAKEITLHEMTIDVFKKLLKRQGKDIQDAEAAPADDAE